MENCLQILAAGGVILFPTDTIWGLGCDATNDAAVERVLQIRGLQPGSGLVVLVPDERNLLQYAAQPNPLIFDTLTTAEKPVTVVYDMVVGLSDLVLAANGSAAIRITCDPFCRHLLKRFRKPIVASAASMDDVLPTSFSAIPQALHQLVDHVVLERTQELGPQFPSQMVHFDPYGNRSLLRF